MKIHAEQLSDQGGASLAAAYGALSADHPEHVSEEGVKAMADHSIVAVLLPGASYFIRESRIPPFASLRRHSVPMAVATDLQGNPSSLIARPDLPASLCAGGITPLLRSYGRSDSFPFGSSSALPD